MDILFIREAIRHTRLFGSSQLDDWRNGAHNHEAAVFRSVSALYRSSKLLLVLSPRMTSRRCWRVTWSAAADRPIPAIRLRRFLALSVAPVPIIADKNTQACGIRQNLFRFFFCPCFRYDCAVPRPSGRMTDLERVICARVKTVRESINWSQAAFAEQLGITRDQLASIECGRTPLRYDIAWRLRQSFGISLRWLDEGWGFPDSLAHDNLPIPTATGLPERALLSAVAQKFSELDDGSLVAIGPESSGAPQQSEQPASQLLPLDELGFPQLPEAVLQLIDGRERATGKTDIDHRALHVEFLRLKIDGWVSNVPLGHVSAFANELEKAAETFIHSLPQDPEEAIERRNSQLIWERIKTANARKVLVASQTKKKVLTEVTPERNLSGMTEIAFLLQRLKRALEGVKKGDLARSLKVPLPRVSEWLSGRVMPSGESALRLLHWVEQREQKLNALGSATNTTKGKVTRRKVVHEKKPTSSHK